MRIKGRKLALIFNNLHLLNFKSLVNLRFNILTLPFLFFSLIINAQSNFDWGIGASYNLHLFQHENKEKFKGFPYKPSSAHLAGLNVYIDFNKNAPFQFRLNIGLGEKRIVLSNKFRLPQTGLKVKSSLNHSILFADISALSILNFNKTRKHPISPILGFFFSLNQYLDFYETTKIGRTGSIDENNIPAFNLEVHHYPFLVYAGVSVGFNFPFEFKNKKIALYSIFNISPSKLFNADFTYNHNTQEQFINGRYHYLSTGINISLQKNKKN